jgi:hypothetical protein
VEFVSCIRDKRQPLTTVRACVDGTRLAIAAEESIKKGAIVTLDKTAGRKRAGDQ